MGKINAKKIARRMRDVQDYIRPLSEEQQQNILFMYRTTLGEMAALLNVLQERDAYIRRLQVGNNQLTKLLEKWIIEHPIPRGKAKEAEKSVDYEVSLPAPSALWVPSPSTPVSIRAKGKSALLDHHEIFGGGKEKK